MPPTSPYCGATKCLLDLKKPKELCNPVEKSVVGAGRETAAAITGSMPSTTSSLLCYQSKPGRKFANDDTAALAGQTAGTNLPESASTSVGTHSSSCLFVSTRNGAGNWFPGCVYTPARRVCFDCLAVSRTP